jgi:hypothetical protein
MGKMACSAADGPTGLRCCARPLRSCTAQQACKLVGGPAAAAHGPTGLRRIRPAQLAFIAARPMSPLPGPPILPRGPVAVGPSGPLRLCLAQTARVAAV